MRSEGVSGRESRCAAAECRPLLESCGVGGGGQIEMAALSGGGALNSPLGHVRAGASPPGRKESESGASSSCAALTTSSGIGTPAFGAAAFRVEMSHSIKIETTTNTTYYLLIFFNEH